MKKNLMTVLILALLVVNIVLTSVMLVSIVGTNKKTATGRQYYHCHESGTYRSGG